ncbi:MAG TPA: acyl-CoA dehydrogenase family protein, partial [Planctomycetota bacterium]|nr:acyl-CoA dehydrogenase family protein [Planctomycetota bacterium]
LREALAEMGRRGLLGLRLPPDLGGRGVSPAEFRRFQEASARASGALAFLESQHQSACGLVARSPNAALRAFLGPRLARGERTSGIAFSHLRRPGAPLCRATPGPGGYVLDGALPWVTGWGLFTDCVTAATLPDGRTLFVRHDLAASGALSASPPLPLAAMSVTQTVTLEARGLVVPESDVVDVRSADWIRENDRLAVALQSPLALGCAQAGIDVLRARGDAAATEAAARLQSALEAARQQAYAAMEEPAPPEKALQARAAAIALAGRCAHAAVVAWAGAGNLADHPAQRVYREALAFSVLALTPPIRQAVLEVLSSKF